MAATASVGAQRQLSAVRQAHPEWASWLALVAETIDAIADPAWDAVALDIPSDHPPTAPLLAGVTVAVPSPLADGWVRHLLDHAGRGDDPAATTLVGAARGGRLDALGLLEAAANQDASRLEALAVALDADPDATAAVAHLAIVPLLQACRRRLGGNVPPTWMAGCCPVCGAWPTMAESRGLERARRLRCGRCGGDWGMVALRCPFCFTDDHQQLGSLVPEVNGETRKVDTCAVCRGYVKTLTTLLAWAPDEVALADLATVDLDLAALDKDFARPDAPAVDLGLRLVPARDPGSLPSQWPSGRNGAEGQA